MSTTYTFHLMLRVDDPQALHAAAMDQLVNEDGMRRSDAEELVGPSNAPKVQDCIIACLDPGQLNGCSIDGSSAEEA